MRKQLATLALAAAMMRDMGNVSMGSPKRGTAPLNGDSRRTHKENVKRRKLRRLVKKAKSINRKNH